MANDERRDSFINVLVTTTDWAYFQVNFPNDEYNNFWTLANMLFSALSKKRNELIEDLKTITDPDYALMMKEEIELLEEKINYCNAKIDTYKKSDIQEDDEGILEGAKTLIFAGITGDKLFIERDLKYVPEEKYDLVRELIDRAREGRGEGNIEHARMMSNNEKLKGIHEMKGFQVRLFYRVIAKDVLFIISLKVKKDDYSKELTSSFIKRKKNTRGEFEFLQEAITDSQKWSEILEVNEKRYHAFCDVLASEKRGRS